MSMNEMPKPCSVVSLAGQHTVLRALAARLSYAFGQLLPFNSLHQVFSHLWPQSKYLGLQVQLDGQHVVCVPDQHLNALGKPAVFESKKSFAAVARTSGPLTYCCTKSTLELWGPNPPPGPLKGALLAVPLLVDPGAELVAAMLVESQQAGSCPTAMFRVWQRYAPYESCIGVLLMEVPAQLPPGVAAPSSTNCDVLDVSMCNIMLVGAMLAPMLLLHGRQRLCDVALSAGLISADKQYAYVPGCGLVDSTEWDCEDSSSNGESPDEVSEEADEGSEGAEEREDHLYGYMAEGDEGGMPEEGSELAAAASIVNQLERDRHNDALALHLYEVVGSLVRRLPNERLQRLPPDLLQLLASLYEHDEVGVRAEALLVGRPENPVQEEAAFRREPGRAFCDIRWQCRGGQGDRDEDQDGWGSVSRADSNRGAQQLDGRQTDGQTEERSPEDMSRAGSETNASLAQQQHEQVEFEGNSAGAQHHGPAEPILEAESEVDGALARPLVPAAEGDESTSGGLSKQQRQQEQQTGAIRDAETQMYVDQPTEERYVMFARRMTQQVHRYVSLLIGVLWCLKLLTSQPFVQMQGSPLLAAALLVQLMTMVVLDNWPAASARQAQWCECLFALVGASMSLGTFPLLCLSSLQVIVEQQAALPWVVLLLLFCSLGHLGGRVRYYWCRMNAFGTWMSFFVWVLPTMCQIMVPDKYYSIALPACSLLTAVLMACMVLLVRGREKLLRHQFEQLPGAIEA